MMIKLFSFLMPQYLVLFKFAHSVANMLSCFAKAVGSAALARNKDGFIFYINCELVVICLGSRNSRSLYSRMRLSCI